MIAKCFFAQSLAWDQGDIVSSQGLEIFLFATAMLKTRQKSSIITMILLYSTFIISFGEFGIGSTNNLLIDAFLYSHYFLA